MSMDYRSITMILISSTWLLSEILINLLTRSKKSESSSHDRHSMGKIWVVIALSVTAGVYIASSYPGSGPVQYFSGITLMVAGIAFRIFTIFSLKSFFTADVAIHHDHKLKTDGVFTYVRHPSYSGSLLTFLGFGLTLGNWFSLLIIFLPVLAVFLYRIGIEEKALIGNFKDEYTVYQKKTKKLVPFIY